jgi:23S rRNA maturation mini-RNase III
MENNFENCAHRSENQVTKKVKTCGCGKYKDVTGFECLKLGFFPLNPSKCENCTVFEEITDS